MKNQIERIVNLNASVERVWVALTDHKEFGSWFRLSLHSPFKVGEVTHGEVTFPGHEGLPFWARVEAMDEPHRFSFVWPMDETVHPDDQRLDESRHWSSSFLNHQVKVRYLLYERAALKICLKTSRCKYSATTRTVGAHRPTTSGNLWNDSWR